MKRSANSKRTTLIAFRMPNELHKEFSEFTAKTGCTQTEVFKRAVREYLGNKKETAA